MSDPEGGLKRSEAGDGRLDGRAKDTGDVAGGGTKDGTGIDKDSKGYFNSI